MAAEGTAPGRAGGIRVRITAAGVAVVAAALIFAGVAMVAYLDRTLRANVRTEAFRRADGIGVELRTGKSLTVVTSSDPEEEFVQVVADRTVVLSSANVEGLEPLLELRPGASGTLEWVPFEEGPFLVVATAADDRTVLVGRALEDVLDAARAVTFALVVGIPLLLLLAGAVTWRVVGRALAPVEAIREEVEAISSSELHRRVPDPPGDDEVSRLATTMNRMLARLEDEEARRRRFVSDASHELRSPVASIRQQAEVALSHPETTDLHSLAEVVLEEDLRLQRIVEDLLLLTRIDEGTLQLRAEPVDLDDLVLEEAARLRTSTDLRVDVGVAAGRVLGDRHRLARLVRNLTENAARHARGAVALSLRRERGEVIVAVEDDGPGIPPEERERVFDRFVRLDEARERDAGGSGLGLSIAREVARLHRGSVAALEGSLGGARFEVRLPVHAD